ncbi:MAG: DUF2065 domain-containing protein [Sphingomonadales bacterium]|nr:DUF2065 domain-containing protein [Sphingomonadales bacterium]
MSIAWSELFVALGLVLVIEGAIYALFPRFARSIIEQALKVPNSVLRGWGLGLAFAGLAIVWFIRG